MSATFERYQEGRRGLDVFLEVRFIGASFSASMVANVVTAVEESAFQVERAEIDELQRMLPEVDSAVFDAMRYRANQYRGRAVTFHGAASGSMILLGIAAGLSYWLLDKTLGETVKEAWKKSGSHEKLVGILSERRWTKAEAIVKRIEPRPFPFSEPRPTVQGTVEERNGNVTAVVTVTPDPLTQPIPPASDVARRAQQ